VETMDKDVFYYLIYNDGGIGKIFPLAKESFKDITEIDLITMNYSKEEFLKLIPSFNVSDIFIARKRKQDLKIYEVFFKPMIKTNPLLAEKIKNHLTLCAQNRLKKINELASNISLDKNESYLEITSMVLNSIWLDSREQLFISRANAIINANVKKEIESVSKESQKYRKLIYLQNLLTSYKVLRGLVIEHLNYISGERKNLKENSSNRARLFLDNYSKYISKKESVQEKKENSTPLTMQEHELIKRIMNEEFDNKEIGEYLFCYGIKWIMENIDANDIYSLSDKDLLRLGIYSPQTYLEKHPIDNSIKF